MGGDVMTPEALDTIAECLLLREEYLQDRITALTASDGRLAAKPLIAKARQEIERIQAVRREMIIESTRGALGEMS
jgi:hypothetical protein